MFVTKSVITLEQLRKVKMRDPEDSQPYNPTGVNWKPIPHADLVEAVIDEAQFRNWSISNCRIALSPDEFEMSVAFDLRLPDLPMPPGFTLGIGFFNSNSRRRALTMYAGGVATGTGACMVLGEAYRRMHTSGFSVHDQVDLLLSAFLDRAVKVPQEVRDLRECVLDERDADSILMQAGRLNNPKSTKRFMPWSRIGRVDRMYRNPVSLRKEKSDQTAWRLYVCFSLVSQMDPAMRQLDELETFRRLLPVPVSAP